MGVIEVHISEITFFKVSWGIRAGKVHGGP